MSKLILIQGQLWNSLTNRTSCRGWRWWLSRWKMSPFDLAPNSDFWLIFQQLAPTINGILADRKFWSQGVQKSPCTIQIASTTSNEEALQNSQARLKKLPAGSIPTGKEREMPREPFWTFLSQDKMHWFFGPYFTETSWAECRNWCSKGNSGPPRALALTQNCHQHQAGKSWPSYTD